MLRTIRQMLLWGLLGALIVPFLGFLFAGITLTLLDPHCGRTSDSGGCAMGLITVPLSLIVPGMILFMSTALLRSVVVNMEGVSVRERARALWRRARR